MQDFMKSMCEKCYSRKYYERNDCNHDFNWYLKMIEGQMSILSKPPPKKKRGRKIDKFIYWVTINPKEGTPLNPFCEKMENFVKRSFVKNFAYSYEQRGKSSSEMGKGIHCHLLFDKPRDLSPKQLLTRAMSTFGDMVGNSKAIHIQTFPYDFRPEKIQYLEGAKWDQEKDASVKINLAWREINKLSSIYIDASSSENIQSDESDSETESLSEIEDTF